MHGIVQQLTRSADADEAFLPVVVAHGGHPPDKLVQARLVAACQRHERLLQQVAGAVELREEQLVAQPTGSLRHQVESLVVWSQESLEVVVHRARVCRSA